jgi:hypothetical protein
MSQNRSGYPPSPRQDKNPYPSLNPYAAQSSGVKQGGTSPQNNAGYPSIDGGYGRRDSQGANRQSYTNQKLPDAVRLNFRRSITEEQQPGGIYIPGFIRQNPMMGGKCGLCEESYPKESLDCIGTCGHDFCIDCLNSYCVYKIDTRNDVTCPQ